MSTRRRHGPRARHAYGPLGQQIAMRDHSGEVADVCIVGAGAAGSVMAAKLAEAGWRVVVLEAGPYWNPARDFVVGADGSLRARGSRQPHWHGERRDEGEEPLSPSSPVLAWGVGGSTVTNRLVLQRAREQDFRRRTTIGELPGVELRDWPLGYYDLEPYYHEVECALGLASPGVLSGMFVRLAGGHGHDLGAAARRLVRGAAELGVPVTPLPLGVLASPHGARPGLGPFDVAAGASAAPAVSSALVTWLPRAVRAGAEIRARVRALRIEYADGRARGVLYRRRGQEPELQRARVVVVAAGALESARLLLTSSDGGGSELANGSGVVGRCVMTQLAHVATASDAGDHPPAGAPVGGAVTEVQASRGAASPTAYSIRDAVRYYGGAAEPALTLEGATLPLRRNRITVHGEQCDEDAVGVANICYGLHEDDRRLAREGAAQMTRLLEAAGGRDVRVAPAARHLLGGCRAGFDGDDAVVDADSRSFEIRNLLVVGAATFPTSLAIDPMLTIQALAARAADRLAAAGRRREG